MALSVAALLVAVAVPRALGAAAHREAGRMPVWAHPPAGTVGLTVESSTTVLGGQQWTQVRLDRGDGHSPVPPGLATLPAPGHTVVSPALQDLLGRDHRQLTGLGTIDPTPIGQAGLVSPDELVSYTRVATEAAAESGLGAAPDPGPAEAVTPDPRAPNPEALNPVSLDAGSPDADMPDAVTSFGPRDGTSDDSSALGLEALVLMAVPALLFLNVCARLSVSSRRTRLAALRLIGVSQDRCARIFGAELAIVAALGAAAGVGLNSLAQPWLAGGVLGVRWFVDDTRTGPVVVCATVVAAYLVAWVIGRRGMRRLLFIGETSRRHRPWRAWVGGALALVGAAFLVVVVTKVWQAPPDDTVLPTMTHVPLVLAACLTTTAGLLLALPWLSAGIGRWLSTTDLPAGLRLGARLAQTQDLLGRRLVSALVATLFVTGSSTAFLYGTYLDAVGDPTKAVLTVDVSRAPQTQRDALRQDLPSTTEISINAASDASPDALTTITVMRCGDYAHAYELTDIVCTPGPLRLGPANAPGAIRAGARLRIAQVGRAPVTITAPEARTGGLGPSDLLIPPDLAPWAMHEPNPFISVTVAAGQADDLQARLRADAPDALVAHNTKDPASLARYQSQTAVLRAALALAYLLCLLMFVFSMTEARWAAERTLVAQRAMGVPSRVTRAAAAMEATLPVAIAVAAGVPAVAASGVAFLAVWGAGQARDLSLWTPLVVQATAAPVLTATVGWLLGRSRLNLEALAET
ncbi:FtsX-like permease family protein [Intrasporangium mesophilum]